MIKKIATRYYSDAPPSYLLEHEVDFKEFINRGYAEAGYPYGGYFFKPIATEVAKIPEAYPAIITCHWTDTGGDWGPTHHWEVGVIYPKDIIESLEANLKYYKDLISC